MLAFSGIPDFFLTALSMGALAMAFVFTLPADRANSELLRRLTQGLPTGVAENLSPEARQRLVRSYFAGVIIFVIAGLMVAHLYFPAKPVLAVFTLLALAASASGQFLLRQHLRRKSL